MPYELEYEALPGGVAEDAEERRSREFRGGSS